MIPWAEYLGFPRKLQQSLQAGTFDQYSLVPLRPSGNATDLDTCPLAQEAEVIARSRRQIVVTRQAPRLGLPAGQRLVDWLGCFEAAKRSGHRLQIAVLRTNRDFVELVEHIQLGDHQAGETVDHGRVAQQRDIKPAAAPRTAGDSAILVTGLPDSFAIITLELGGKRAAANASCVGL